MAHVMAEHVPDDEQVVPEPVEVQSSVCAHPNPGAQSGSYVHGEPTPPLAQAPGVPTQAKGATHPPGFPGGLAPSPHGAPASASIEQVPVWAAQ